LPEQSKRANQQVPEGSLEIMANSRKPRGFIANLKRRSQEALAIGRETELICVDGTKVSLVKDRNSYEQLLKPQP